MLIKEFAEKHNMPEEIVIQFVEKIGGVPVCAYTHVNEEGLLELLKPLFKEFKRQNPIVGKWDPTDICK